MKKEKLHKIAPILSEISHKKNAFNVPKNYFNTIEDEVITSMKLDRIQPKSNAEIFNTPSDYFENVENITISKLKAEVIGNENNTEIPSDYFDTFEDRVLTKLNTKPKVISIRNIAKYVAPIAVAASLLLFVILKTNQKEVTFDSLATTEIEHFIESGLVDISPSTLLETFNEIDISEANFTVNISDEEVLNYLTVEDLETIIYED